MASKNPLFKGTQTIIGYIEMFPVIAYGAYLARQDNSFDSLAPSIFFALISVIFVVPAVAFILRFGAQLFKDQELTIKNALLPASANCYGTVFGEDQLGRELLEEVGIDLSNQAEQAVTNPQSIQAINFIKGGVANAGKKKMNKLVESGKNMYTRLVGGGTNQPTLSNDTRQRPLSKEQVSSGQPAVKTERNIGRLEKMKGKMKSEAGKESVGRRLKQEQGEVGKPGKSSWRPWR